MKNTKQKPKHKFTPTVEGATKLHQLSVTHRTEIEPRLPGGTIDGLATDISALRGDSENVVHSRGVSKAATELQGKALEEGFGLVRSLQGPLALAIGEDDELLELFGIGRKVDSKSVKSVAAAIQSTLKGATEKPEIARAGGILPSDLDELTAAHTALVGADTIQGHKQLSSKQATAQRNETHLRVERTMELIVAVARVVFRKRPEVLVQFEETLPKRTTHKAAKKPETEPVPNPG